MAYQLVTTTEREYYKYSTTVVSQNPTLSADPSAFKYPFLTNFSLLGNDTELGVRASAYYGANYPWHVFDGADNTVWISNTGFPVWIAWSTPYPFRLGNNAYRILVTNYTANFPRGGTLDYSDDGENWTSIITWSSSAGSGSQWAISFIEPTGYHKYYRLNITSASNASIVDIKKIEFSGIFQKINKGTSSNYNFYEDKLKYKCIDGKAINI